MFRVYAYLRASTNEQDAGRAKEELLYFAHKNDFQIASFFVEHESGARLQRPELFRLLDIAQPGDMLLVEQVDRISRLNTEDWETLKSIIKAKQIRVIALDLPTSHQLIATSDEFTNRMLSALNDMMLDMLAAIARKDYEDRRRRQAQGIAKAQQEGKYRGRPQDLVLQRKIADLLKDGKSYSQIVDYLGCSRRTIAKVAKKNKDGVANDL
ncbi:recombinase family protein [Algicola sagamiensis]|uniref:recombinase family protein n=1 Tax=Algicola sagamiensis TaxID=163869 RepID=UPI0003627E1D|nr:recombinase family protein [Algicola sagamiensis]